MSFYQINGGRRLEGELAVQGAKNSVLPILAATLLAPGESVIHNCPDLSDVTTTLDILRMLGCQVSRSGDTVTVDATAPSGAEIPDCLMRELRSSVIFLGALLARMGEATMSLPGGCDLGPRPIDLHLMALRLLGAEIQEAQGFLHCQGKGNLSGREICFSIPSVGATENAMLAACGCPGVTTIVGGAREPEIVDLQEFLRAMGAHIEGAGTSIIRIEGGIPLHPAEYTVMGDRIAAATYLSAVAAAGGSISLQGVQGSHLATVLSVLEEGGCWVKANSGGVIELSATGGLRGVSPIRTAPYPAFPTDAQALMMAVFTTAKGSTLFVENMFDSRYHHVDELIRMGASIQVVGRVAVVTGVKKLHGATVKSPDLRGGAALVVAALGAEGTSRIHELRHIRRGYEGLDKNLAALGGDIQLVLN